MEFQQILHSYVGSQEFDDYGFPSLWSWQIEKTKEKDGEYHHPKEESVNHLKHWIGLIINNIIKDIDIIQAIDFDLILKHRINNNRMIYFLVEYSFLFAVCGYLVNFYAAKDVSNQVKFWSVLTWVLNFALALLVPEDLYQTFTHDSHGQAALSMQYLILYWVVYLLTWTVIPVLQEWEDSGDIQSINRLKRSFRSNGIFYLYMLIGAVVALIVLILLHAGGDMGLITFLKCLATIWGIFLMIVLMGYSLVQIPKTMWRNAEPKDYLVYLYQRVFQVEQDVEDSLMQFRKVVAYIEYSRKNAKGDPQILRYCDFSMGLIPPVLKAKINKNFESVLKQLGYLQTYPVCLESSIEHNRLLKRAIARCRRQQKSFDDYVRQAIFYEDVQESIDKEIPLKTKVKKVGKLGELWYVKIRRKFNKIGALLIGVCSVILLISQTQVFLSSQSTILSNIVLVQNPQVMRVLCFLVMGFIVYMSNYGLFRLKLANLYGLYPKESDGASLMFATINFSRIGVAIVLNFFDMMKMENSVYAKVMGAPSMGLLGDWVIRGLPGVLWLIVLCHLFNVWGWIAQKLNFNDSFSFNTHELDPKKAGKSPYQVQKRRRQLQKMREQDLMRSSSQMVNF